MLQNTLLRIDDELDDMIVSWLNYQDSLTERLREQTGEAQLHLLKQGWAKANWWDKFFLQLKTTAIFQREIVMFSLQKPCWYARTIIPQSTYEKNSTFFYRLNHESMGALIFNEPRVRRNFLTNYTINKDLLEYYWLKKYQIKLTGDQCWARLSEFNLEGDFFYLIEIILPTLKELRR